MQQATIPPHSQCGQHFTRGAQGLFNVQFFSGLKPLGQRRSGQLGHDQQRLVLDRDQIMNRVEKVVPGQEFGTCGVEIFKRLGKKGQARGAISERVETFNQGFVGICGKQAENLIIAQPPQRTGRGRRLHKPCQERDRFESVLFGHPQHAPGVIGIRRDEPLFHRIW